jgi:hypothetical protein
VPCEARIPPKTRNKSRQQINEGSSGD